jgi:probable HAF family extracellular repeat protein
MYDVEEIGPWTNTIMPVDLNNRGEVVGGVFGAVPGGFGYTAFYWSGGVFVHLGANWENASSAVSVNNSGVILGTVEGYGDEPDRMFEIDAEGNISYPAPFDPPIDVRARAINDSGQIVGTYQLSPNGASVPFFWDRTVVYDLVPDWADLVFLGGLNNLGQVAGTSRDDDCGNSGFLWEQDYFTEIGLCADQIGVNDINDTSRIVGSMVFEGGDQRHAFLFEDSDFVDLGVLVGEEMSIAYDINRRGWIVGDSSSSQPPSRRAFVFINGVMYDLNDFVSTETWHLTRALKINDRGQILMEANPTVGFGATFLLLTPSSISSIERLIELILSFELPHGIEHSLVVKLEHASEAIDAGDLEGACTLLRAFINHVNAQTGKKLPEMQAEDLLEAARQIQGILLCP